MTTFFVSRHSGAVEWAARQGIRVDKLVAHLDPAVIQPGDSVIGTLPVNLAAEVCARGGRFYNLSLQLPPEARGRELSADELERFGATLAEFRVHGVVMPVEIRNGMVIKEGDTVLCETVDGEARLTIKLQRMRRAQELVARFCPKQAGESIVDDFIAERRAEAAEE